MKAFAGESQARNRYTFAAELAKNENKYVIKKVFDLTAAQEQQHAKVFYDFLKELDGTEIPIEASYPVNTAQSVEEQLKQAVQNEVNEGKNLYRQFGDVALEEGFSQIAGKFYMIADVENIHAKRFELFYNLLKEGKLFASDVKTGWICLGCGYMIEATTAPQNCPACDADQGYFVRVDLSPYTEESFVDKDQTLGNQCEKLH